MTVMCGLEVKNESIEPDKAGAKKNQFM